MRRFVCPACGQRTIALRARAAATSFDPARCRSCGAAVYPSGKKTYLARSLESLIVSMIVILALVEFSWLLVGLALAVVVVAETAIVFFVPLVERRYMGRSG